MDLFQDPSVKLKYQKCKMKVKLWESEFRQKHGTNPSKDDIKEASPRIREAYKWYWRLKIHSLGQDSLLDATFEEDPITKHNTALNSCSLNLAKNFQSPDTVPSLPVSISERTCKEVVGQDIQPVDDKIDLNDQFSRKALGDIQNDVLEASVTPPERTSPSESNHLPNPGVGADTKQSNSSNDLTTTAAECCGKDLQNERTDPNSDKVWGSHLSKSKETVKKLIKPGLGRSSSFQLSEKLFVGSKFRKRNPRKSLSFSHGKDKNRHGFTSVGSSSNLPSTSTESAFSQPLHLEIPDSQDTEDGFPVSSLLADSKNSSSSKNICKEEKFVIVRNSTSSLSQPISAVSKILDEGALKSKSRPEWKVDFGWLERVSQASSLSKIQTQSENVHCSGSDEAVIPSNPCQNERGSLPLIHEQQTKNSASDSDEDFVYDSDTEEKSDVRPKRELSSRLSLLSNVSQDVSSPAVFKVQNENRVNAEPENPKKRKLDAIEAAMAVLSERRKVEREASLPSKKSKRCSAPKKNIEVEQQDNGDGCDEDDPAAVGDVSTVGNKSSGVKMTKKDLLEKKVSTGSVNDNFVRINLKKKVFVRGKKTMTFQKYKKQQWKNRKKELASGADAAYISRMDPSDGAAGGGLQKCFKCGDVGHYARGCLKMRGDSLMPVDGDEVDESPFPTLEEVEALAREKSESVHARLKARQAFEDENVRMSQVTVVPTYRAIPLTENGGSESLCEDPEVASQIESLQTSVYNFEDDDMMDLLKEPDYVKEINFGSVQPLYPLQKDGTVIPTPPEVHECLQLFGHEKFRPGQEEAVMRILSGLSTLVTLSTGSGKSLCYQLPAYLYACRNRSITLVVSPLVSLMDDQVTGLPPFIKAAALHTSQTPKQREKVMEMVKSGKLQFLLVSPEAVVAGEKRTGFGSILRELPDIAFACIDEAHCVSQWSHNFRPSYLMICKVLREKLGIRTVLGLTATATRATVTSIIEHLNIPDGLRGVIQDVPLPNNLLLTVSRDSQRDRALIQLLSTSQFEKYESIIIYCTRREECERLAGIIRSCLRDQSRPDDTTKRRKVSMNAEAYHAGLSSSRRKQVQSAFMSGQLRIVVATVAFGMGINKANIRAVIHYNMPRSFESYVQEVGRAGRDGKNSHCHLFLNSEGGDLHELRRHIHGDSMDRHTIRKLLQRVFIPCKCKEKTRKNQKSNMTEVQTGITSQEVPSDNISVLEEAQNVNGNNSNTLLEADGKNESLSVCEGHEVGFNIEETVAALDLPEENITTLLCYLELHQKRLIKVLSHAYTICKVQSYCGMKHIKSVAKTCPPLAMAIAMDMIRGVVHEKSHTLEFPVVEIATAIGWDSGIVKHELKNLEWTKVNDQPRRSGIKVDFSGLGFRVRAPGDLSPEELDSTLDFLYGRVDSQERSALCQLQAIFSTLSKVSFPDIRSVENSTEVEERSEALKTVIRSYFQREDPIADEYKAEVKLENGEQIASDIRQLVSMYRDCSFTGRAVARIFHGISSPNFPAHVWGRCRFWRAHLHADFKLICLLATRVLLQLK